MHSREINRRAGSGDYDKQTKNKENRNIAFVLFAKSLNREVHFTTSKPFRGCARHAQIYLIVDVFKIADGLYLIYRETGGSEKKIGIDKLRSKIGALALPAE